MMASSQPLSPLEADIPMRDGEVLAADVYVPSGCTSCPSILIQTPYWKFPYRYNLPLDIGTDIDNSPYAFVIVDWRGFWGSLGALNGLPNRGEDGYDCVEWIAQQSWSNGRIGTWGPSALGNIQFQTARENPPHLTCCVPVVSAPQTKYENYYPGGVLRTEYVEQLGSLGFGTTLITDNPYYNFLWQGTETATWYPQDINVPTFMIGGWFDHNVNPMLDWFPAMMLESSASADHKLMFGPWTHGGHGEAAPGTVNQGDLNFPEAENWNNTKALEFLAFHLLDEQNGWENQPTVQYFQMGMNEWLGTNEWPPASTLTDYYLGSLAYLGTSLGTPGEIPVFSNPREPSPTIGGPTLQEGLLQGPYDISTSVEARFDYVLFETETLPADVSVQGKINVKLFVSTEQLDADVAIRLTEVNGTESIMLRDAIQRLRFRNGFSEADEAFCTQGEVYEINIELDDIAHTFKAGNKIRLLVSGANYPRFDVNLNNGQTMYTAGDTITSETNIHFGIDYPSRLQLPIVSNVSVEESLRSEFNIYPNPASEVVWIESDKTGTAKCKLLNVLGEEMGSFNMSDTKYKLDVGHLKPGIYFLEMNTYEALTKINRFVKL